MDGAGGDLPWRDFTWNRLFHASEITANKEDAETFPIQSNRERL
jgi:hypothetical protein